MQCFLCCLCQSYVYKENQLSLRESLTPRLNSTETSLQLSENTTLFAVCRIYTGVISKETYISNESPLSEDGTKQYSEDCDSERYNLCCSGM
jgi:hypothetical protein